MDNTNLRRLLSLAGVIGALSIAGCATTDREEFDNSKLSMNRPCGPNDCGKPAQWIEE